MLHIVPRNSDPQAAFQIRCDGCSLSARWLPDYFVPEEVRKAVPKTRILAVLGYETPSNNLKYLPARKGLEWAIAEGLTGPGRKILVPSSGNFLESEQVVIDEEGIELTLIGVVSSKLPTGKRLRLERRGISLITELDLQRELGLKVPDATLKMLKAYSTKVGIPVLDQYDCTWNSDSYLPIPEEVYEQIGPISFYCTTAGTKGKHRVGVEMKRRSGRTLLVVVFPKPGHAFPGGRNEELIKEVANKFGIEPMPRHTDELVAYERIGQLYPEGITAGVTFGAEVGVAQDFLLEMLVAGRIDELLLDDGSITVLIVCSDSIFPYISEGKRRLPHLFGKIPDPS